MEQKTFKQRMNNPRFHGMMMGIIIGIGMSVAFDNWGIGIAMGVALGAAFGPVFKKQAEDNKKNED